MRQHFDVILEGLLALISTAIVGREKVERRDGFRVRGAERIRVIDGCGDGCGAEKGALLALIQPLLKRIEFTRSQPAEFGATEAEVESGDGPELEPVELTGSPAAGGIGRSAGAERTKASITARVIATPFSVSM